MKKRTIKNSYGVIACKLIRIHTSASSFSRWLNAGKISNRWIDKVTDHGRR